MKLFMTLASLLAVTVAKPGNLIAYSHHYGYAAAPLLAARSGFSYSTVTAAHSPQLTYAYAHAPLAYNAAPIVAAPLAYAAHVVAPVAAIEKTQYHAQNELGQAQYGHSEAFQQHNAVQDVGGNKAGSYSYVAPDGQVIAASYVADALGYRVVSNALPVGPSETPLTPQDTPEVVEARAAHLAAFEEIKHRARRGIYAPLAYAPLAYSPLAYNTHLPYVAAPLVRAATLTTVVNNPGHAVSYRVD